MLKKLEEIGLRLDYGEDGTGWQFKYLTRGGGYYFNVGASNLMADKKIKLIQFSDIEKFNNSPFCAEVNIKPKNEVSLNFHKKMGFKETSIRKINKEHEVIYLERYEQSNGIDILIDAGIVVRHLET